MLNFEGVQVTVRRLEFIAVNPLVLAAGRQLVLRGIVIPYWSDVRKDDLVYFAKLAEELGYHSIWVPEMWGRDAFSLISQMISVTRRIRLATGVVSV